jgi:hypothetical protein
MFAICLLAVAPGARASIVLTNGDFATVGPVIAPDISAAAGWTNNSIPAIEAGISATGFEATANIGGNYLRLASDNNGLSQVGFIVQNLGTMIAGQTYTFTGTALGGASIGTTWGAMVELTSDGTATPATVYATQVLSGFTAGEYVNGALSISFSATAADDGLPLFLWIMTPPVASGEDIRGGIANIQLSTSGTPEPGTIGMMGIGLAAVFVAIRRRAIAR